MNITLPRRTYRYALAGSTGSPRRWIRDGWLMAQCEGATAFDSIEKKHAAEVSAHETIGRALKARGRVALERRTELEHSLQRDGFDSAQRLKDFAQGRVDLVWAVGLSVLNAALVVFVLLAFGPSWLALLLALTVLASTATVEEFFQAYEDKVAFHEAVFLALAVLALAAQFWLGTLRGTFLLAATPEAMGPVTEMFRRAAPILKFSVGVLALVTECLCGYKWHRVRVQLYSATARAVRERDRLNGELVGLQAAVSAAEREADIRRAYRQIGARQYLAGETRAVEQAERDHLKRAAIGAAVALLILILLGLFFLTPLASAIERPGRRIVVLIDRTKSVSEENFQQNLQAVTSVLSAAPMGHRVIVAGITDSFGRPEILLDHTLPAKAGYLDLDLQVARERLIFEWREIAHTLMPSYRQTDLLGSLALLDYLGDGSATETVLIVLSDLRQSSKQLDLEHVPAIHADRSLERLKKAGAIPALPHTRVFLLGVDPSGKSAAYFAGLKDFWLRFFAEAGATVETFSVTRQMPAFESALSGNLVGHTQKGTRP
jgi:outer membrane protein OmpA-like peptidoglycan-associated protein